MGVYFFLYFMSILVLQSSIWGRERELVDLLVLSSWCLVIVVWLFLAILRVCLWYVIVVFPDHTHSLFLKFYVTDWWCSRFRTDPDEVKL